MALFRTQHDKENPYTVVNKTIASDDRISWKAKGIWLYAFSRPNDWTFYLCDIVKQSKDGKESVRSGLKELEEAGYLYRTYKKDPKTGQMLGAEYVFFETPKTQDEIKEMFPKYGKPVSRETRTAGNPPLLNKEEELNNDNNKNPPNPPCRGEPRSRDVDKSKRDEKKSFGSDGLVRLTDEEHANLKEIIPNLPTLIEELNDYIASTGRRYKSHFHTIRSWSRRKTQSHQPKKSNSNPCLSEEARSQYDDAF